jgi:hypothetical protein
MWCYLFPHQNILSRFATNQLTRLCVAEPVETDQITNSDMMSPMEEHPQYIYATNGYVDQTGGPPPPVYYINGESLRLRAYEQLPDAYIAVYVCTRFGCRFSWAVIYAVVRHSLFLSSYYTLPAENDSDKFVIFDSLRPTFSRVADIDSDRLKTTWFSALASVKKDNIATDRPYFDRESWMRSYRIRLIFLMCVFRTRDETPNILRVFVIVFSHIRTTFFFFASFRLLYLS